MSDRVYRNKLAVPQYYVGDLSQAYVQGRQLALSQQQIDARKDALTAERQKAQAKKAADQQAEQAKILGMMGGLYEDTHPYALPFIEEAYGMLQQEIMPLMYTPNGSEAAKLYIANWKRDAAKYQQSDPMKEARKNMQAMLDPQSTAYREAKKQAGALYRPMVSLDDVEAADSYQFSKLMEGAELEYKNGSFTIKGLAYDPSKGLGNDIIPLEEHPRFNDENVFRPRMQPVSGTDFQTLGQAIQIAKRVGDNVWNWDEITADYSNYFSGSLPFEDLDRESNEAYQYRLQSFMLGKDDIRTAAGSLAPMNDEVLLDMYSLDEKYKQSSPTVYNLIQEQLKSYWETDLKPHTKWTTDSDDDDGSVQFLASSEPTTLSTDELPKQLYSDPNNPAIQEGENYPFMAIPAEVAEGRREMKTAAYATQSLPNPQMENIEIPLVNTKYYQQMKIYEAAELIIYDPFGRPVVNPNMEGLDTPMMEGVINLLQKSDLIKAQKLNSLIAYEGNPNVVGIATGDGTIEVINLSDLGPRQQVVMANINAGLDKMGYEWKDIYNHALGNYFNGTPQTVVFD
jgi:hypothetical protein